MEQMNTNQDICLLAHKCKKAGDPNHCDHECFPFIRLHGETGKGGVLGVAGVPKAYRKFKVGDLPFKMDNPDAYKSIALYCKGVSAQVEDGTSLYLHGIPNTENPKGCGNGKTTSAATILNEYLIARVIQSVQKEKRIDDIPALFVNVSKFQNIFNSMFRGTALLKDQAAETYYRLKGTMKKVPLLVMDDIGVRNSTESFKSEFYEIIDDRANEELSTIYTSNVPIDDLVSILDDRIASRIEGSAIVVPFTGADKRRGLK